MAVLASHLSSQTVDDWSTHCSSPSFFHRLVGRVRRLVDWTMGWLAGQLVGQLEISLPVSQLVCQ